MRNIRRSLIISSATGKSDIPQGYTRLEYIGSTNLSQYIDTGINATNEDVIHVKFSVKSDTGTVLGSSNSSSRGYPGVGIYHENVLKWRFGNTTIESTSSALTVDTVHDAVLSYRKFVLDSVEYVATKPESWADGLVPLMIFGINIYNYGRRYINNTRVYEFSITRNGNVICELIPCLDNNNVPCMYDKAREITLYNGNSGNFDYA